MGESPRERTSSRVWSVGALVGAVASLLEEGFPASVPVAVDPGAGGESEGEGDDLGQDVQPEVFWVETELVRQARDHLVLDLGAVVLDVSEQGRLGHYQAAGGDEALVPAGVESRDARGQRLVQLAEDDAGQLAAGQHGQVCLPQLGLGLDRRGLLGREEAEEGALGHLGLVGQFLQRGRVEPLVGEQAQRRVGQRAAGPQLLALAQRQGPVEGRLGGHAWHHTRDRNSGAKHT